MSPAAKRAWAIGAAAFVLLVTGFGWWNYQRSKPSDALLLQELDRRSKGAAHYEQVKVSITRLTDTSVRVDFSAKGRYLEALYRAENTREYLAREFGYDPAAVEAAAGVLRRKDAPRLLEWAKLGPPPADPLSLVILREQAPQGGPVAQSGRVEATRTDTGWALVFSPAPAPDGQRRSNFSQPTYVAGTAEDRAALKTRLEHYQTYADRVVAAAGDFAQKLAEERAARVDRLLNGVKSGVLYSGIATNGQESQVLYLEFSASKKTPATLTALLRNDGGWLDARGFTGSWRTDADASQLTLDLATQENQAIPNGGPFLASWAWSMQLALDESGRLVGRSNGGWQLAFERVPEAEAAKVRAQGMDNFEEIFALTAPGSVLLGAGANRTSGASEALLLHFTQQDRKAGIVRGYFQSPERHNRRREFGGVIVASKYRSNGLPLRLSLPERDRSRQAPTDTLLGYPADRELHLRAEAGDLVGEMQGTEYHFARATPPQLAELEHRRQEQAELFAATFRTGAVYDGTIRNDSGYVSPVRLRLQQLDTLEHTVTYSLDSREFPGVYRQFSGTYDVAGLTVDAQSTQKFRLSNNPHCTVPFYKFDHAFNLRLTRNEGEITGLFLNWGNGGWSLEFLVAAQPAAAPGSGTGTAEAALWPEAEGAYVLKDGAWLPLPHNNGKVTYGAPQVLNNVLGVLNGLTGRPNPDKLAEGSDKLADLTFDGDAPIPQVPPQSVTVLFVGVPAGVPTEQLSRHPELAEYPVMEMAATQTDAGGRRQADLLRIVQGVAGFREKRIAALLEKSDEKHFLLTATAPIPGGTYALSVQGGQCFELRIGR